MALFPTCRIPFSRTRRRQKIIALIGFVSVVLYNIPNRFEFSNTNIHGLCTLPEVDPFDPELMKFDDHAEPVSCENSVSIMYIDRRGFLQFNTTALSLQNISKVNVDCTFRHVERTDDNHVILKPEVRFVKPVYIPSDFIVVKCSDSRSKRVMYESLLLHIDYKTLFASKNIRSETKDQLSIWIFGIDSLSKNMAVRKIPKAVKYFEDVLGGITFKGYTKVGDSTFPNVIPLLTGLRADPEELGHHWGSEYFDKWPLIGYNFSAAGYATLYAEDCPYISTFNYLANGYDKQPTDHYIRPLYMAMRTLKPLTSFELVFLYLENKDIKFQSSSLCYGNRMKHHLYLEYIKRFMDVYKNKRKFAHTWWNELSHEYPKYLELGDQDIVDLLKWMKDEGHLERTMVILVSDHGSRTDEIRNTAPGRIEVRMPLLSIVLPDALKQRYPDIVETMWQNTKVITTPFDVNALMTDVLHGRFDHTVQVMKDGRLPRGISLFRKIPKERTCADAGIHETFCACFTSKHIDVRSRLVQHIAGSCVDKINKRLDHYSDKCAHLLLSNIRDAELIESNFKRIKQVERFTLNNNKPEEDKNKYLVVFETSPGGALFEVTVNLEENNDVTVIGDIIRSNKYGNQSYCIDQRLLRTYCFCK